MSALDVGYGNGVSFSSLKSSKPKKPTTWNLLCNAFCVGQMLGGVLLCSLSLLHLFDTTLLMGVLVGGLLFLVGGVGLAGSLSANRDLLNFHLVGAILGIILSFQFVGQVWREVDVDCSLAELYVKSNLLEDVTRNMAHDSMFDSVYKRLNEMEDMLDVMHYGLGRTVEFLKDTPGAKGLDQEKAYLMTKLEVIRRHASKIIQDIVDHPDITNEEVEKWSEQDRKMVESKVKTAEVILYQIQQFEKDDKKNPIRPEQYEEMISQIYSAVNIPTIPGKPWEHEHSDVNELKDDVAYTKEMFKKLTDPLDNLAKISDEHASLTENNAKKLEEYRNEFLTMLEQSKQKKFHDHHADMLRMMPEHCVEESKVISSMGFVGITVAFFLLTTIYGTLCISFRLPIKTE